MDPACEALKTHIQQLLNELNEMRLECEEGASGAEEEIDCGEGTSAEDSSSDGVTITPLDGQDSREELEEEEWLEEPDLIGKLMQEMNATLNNMVGEDFEKLQEAAAMAKEEIKKIKTILEFLERIEDEGLRLALKYQYLASWIEEHRDEDEEDTDLSDDTTR